MMGLLYNRIQKYKNEVGNNCAASHVRKYKEILKHKETTFSELFVISTTKISLDSYEVWYILSNRIK